MTTNPNLDQAREWAKGDFDQAYIHDGPRAAAEVINALPDEWIDADEVRELAFDMDNWDDLSGPDEDRVLPMMEKLEGFAKRLNSLLPTPKPRTLADMDDDEREACQWMQATFTKSHHEHIITQVFGKKARLLRRADGAMFEVRHDEVIPLPGLSRMVWPEEQATEETPELEEGIYGHALWEMVTKAIRSEKEYHIDAQDYEGVKRWRDAERALGTAMGTNPPKGTLDPPEPEDAPDGYYLVHWWGEEHPVPAEKVQGQWWVIGKETFLHPKDVFIVSRLVMEGWV